MTQGDRQQLLPTSNARKLPTDIEILIEFKDIQAVDLPSESGRHRRGYRANVKLDQLKNKGIFPEDGQWKPHAWRAFLQAEAFQVGRNTGEENSVSPPRSALAPARLLLRVNRENRDELREERRPDVLEWIPKPVAFAMMPPEDLADRRGSSADRHIPDASRLARFPMPKLLEDSATKLQHAPKFNGSLTNNVQYQEHPAKIRCLRLLWNQAPSHLPDYPVDLHAGYEILELDIDAHTEETFNDAEKLAQVLRRIQDVQLIPGQDTLLTPGDTLTPNQWEAWYPSTMVRKTLPRPEGSNLPFGAWYSWRESLLEWPEWPALEAQREGQGGRPALFHPCLQAILEMLEENYTVDVQTSPPTQPTTFADFLTATAPKSDPYGWGVLQRLGLSVTFSLRRSLESGAAINLATIVNASANAQNSLSAR